MLIFLFFFFFLGVNFRSGHGSFSNDTKLNSVVGHLLHSSILVPYHGWLVLLEFYLFLGLHTILILPYNLNSNGMG